MIKTLSKCTFFTLLISTLISTFSCSNQKNEEKKRWNEFYIRFLFIEGASFTLYGSKPITEIILDHRTKEEKEAERNQNISNLSKKKRKELESQGLKWNPVYDFEESWIIWEKNLKNDFIKDYIFIHFPLNVNGFDFVFFVNIIETAKILQKHYILFSKYVGFDFDPLEIVFDISNTESNFWNKIFNVKNHDQEKICLIGILFGYGLENSYSYSLIFHKNNEGKIGEFVSNFLNRVIKLEAPENLTKIRFVSTSNFPIPGFKSFINPDPKVEQYQKEKESIKHLYKDQDIEATTMKKLYGIDFR